MDEILDILYTGDGRILRKMRSRPSFTSSIRSFNVLYERLSEKITSDCARKQQIVNTEISAYTKCNVIMLKIFQFQDVTAETVEMPNWLPMMIQSAKQPVPSVCTVSIGRFLNLLQLLDLTRTPGGGSITHIQRLIAGEGPSVVDGQHTVLYSDLVSEMKQKDPGAAEAVRNRFLAHLQGPDRDYRPPQEAGEVEGAEQEVTGHSHCKAIIKNLWDLLSQDIDSETIVGQLREFERHVPLIFSAVIIDELECHDVDRQDEAIKKFAKFWKYTGSKPGEPMYQPFTQEFCGRRNYVLHKMIQFLESADPTLRLSCRSWLS